MPGTLCVELNPERLNACFALDALVQGLGHVGQGGALPTAGVEQPQRPIGRRKEVVEPAQRVAVRGEVPVLDEVARQAREYQCHVHLLSIGLEMPGRA